MNENGVPDSWSIMFHPDFEKLKAKVEKLREQLIMLVLERTPLIVLIFNDLHRIVNLNGANTSLQIDRRELLLSTIYRAYNSAFIAIDRIKSSLSFVVCIFPAKFLVDCAVFDCLHRTSFNTFITVCDANIFRNHV